jgi:histidine ammonia-lyase
MNAAQGIEFRRPLKSSPYIEKVLSEFRKEVPFVDEDVVMEDYIAKTMSFLDGFDVNLEEVVD